MILHPSLTAPRLPSAPLRVTARMLWELRRDHGDEAFKYAIRDLAAQGQPVKKIIGDWRMMARPAQIRPLDCAPMWVLIWGRAAGKTQTAAEDTLDHMEDWGDKFVGALCSKTIPDVRKTMVDGPSGLVAAAKRRGYELKTAINSTVLLHPNGAKLHLLSAEQKDMGAGLNLNFFWADEIALWGHDALKTFKIFLLAWRIKAPTPDGKGRGVVTTTPRPNPITRYLLEPKKKKLTTVTTQSTYDNASNIDIDKYVEEYEGTRLGRQELYAELLDSACLLLPEDIEKGRVISTPELSDVVVAVDPGIDDKENSDDTGICVVGATSDERPICYTLESVEMPGAPWSGWAQGAVRLALRHRASRIVAETNQGGHGIVEALEGAMETLSEELGIRVEFPVVGVWQKVSKRARAEPCAAKVEQGRVKFLGHHKQVEKELTTWVEGMDSPNAMDAWTMGVSALLFGDTAENKGIAGIPIGAL